MKKSEFNKLKRGDTVTLRTKDEMMSVKKTATDLQGNLHVVDDSGREVKFPNIFLGEEAIVVNEHWRTAAVLVKVRKQYHVVVVRQHLKGKTK